LLYSQCICLYKQYNRYCFLLSLREPAKHYSCIYLAFTQMSMACGVWFITVDLVT